MTVAEKILKVRKAFQTIACLDQATDIDQDWENEVTVYTFSDGSIISDNNGNLSIVK